MTNKERLKRLINAYKMGDVFSPECMEYLKIIKRDLEILDILYKYIHVFYHSEDKKPNEYIAIKANVDRWGGTSLSSWNEDKRVVEDFEKIKEWLNDR